MTQSGDQVNLSKVELRDIALEVEQELRRHYYIIPKRMLVILTFAFIVAAAGIGFTTFTKAKEAAQQAVSEATALQATQESIKRIHRAEEEAVTSAAQLAEIRKKWYSERVDTLVQLALHQELLMMSTSLLAEAVLADTGYLDSDMHYQILHLKVDEVGEAELPELGWEPSLYDYQSAAYRATYVKELVHGLKGEVIEVRGNLQPIFDNAIENAEKKEDLIREKRGQAILKEYIEERQN